jgi:PAS domain S-box-containing protein
VIEAAALGVVLHRLRRRSEDWVSPMRLWLFGLLVHVIMLLLQLMIPNSGWPLLRRIGPSVLIFYPLGFLLIAQVFLDGERRRKAVKAMRESEERYRSIFKNNHAVMMLLDPDEGWIVDANPAACAFYGWSADRLRAMKITDINTLSPEEIQAELNRAKTSQRNYFLFQHRRAMARFVTWKFSAARFGSKEKRCSIRLSTILPNAKPPSWQSGNITSGPPCSTSSLR